MGGKVDAAVSRRAPKSTVEVGGGSHRAGIEGTRDGGGDDAGGSGLAEDDL